jgi:hypothetical protein
VYYFKYEYTNIEESSPFVKIIKASLLDYKNIKFISNLFFDETLLVTPDYNFLFCYIDNNGPVPAIIKINNSNQIQQLDIQFDDYCHIPFYDLVEKSLIFYNNFDISKRFSIKIP